MRLHEQQLYKCALNNYELNLTD